MGALWEAHERDLQEMLGLDATVASGSQFWDSGDAVDNNGASPWPLWVDGKCTEKKSYSVKRDEVSHWQNRAEMLGKRFMLAIRFFDLFDRKLCADYALIPMEDYVEMLNELRKAKETA